MIVASGLTSLFAQQRTLRECDRPRVQIPVEPLFALLCAFVFCVWCFYVSDEGGDNGMRWRVFFVFRMVGW